MVFDLLHKLIKGCLHLCNKPNRDCVNHDFAHICEHSRIGVLFYFIVIMRNYLLIVNGVAIKDYFRRGTAENAFRRFVNYWNGNGVVELYSIPDGRAICSTI